MFTHEPEDNKCPFCAIASGRETDLNKKTDIVFENEDVMAYVSPKWWVNNPGNVMIVTRKHVENIFDISDDLLSEVNRVGKKIALAMKETYKCEGISFRQHNEEAGGQSVLHFHLHVFPRWRGDDLYSNHKKNRYVSAEDRLPYAEKLREYLKK